MHIGDSAFLHKVVDEEQCNNTRKNRHREIDKAKAVLFVAIPVEHEIKEFPLRDYPGILRRAFLYTPS